MSNLKDHYDFTEKVVIYKKDKNSSQEESQSKGGPITDLNGGDDYSNETEYIRGEAFRTYDVTQRYSKDYVKYGKGGFATSSESQLFEDMSSLIGDAMSAKGLNLQDPEKTFMFHYNKSGKIYIDPSQYGKTLVFFTRPDLNLCRANIDSVPYFKWLFSTQMGKEIFSMLTGPDRAVYGNSLGITSEELEEKKVDLTATNPLDFLATSYSIATAPGNALRKFALNRVAEQIEFMKKNIGDVVDNAINAGKNKIEEWKQIGIDIANKINEATKKIGRDTTVGLLDELGVDKIMNGTEKDDILIENKDPTPNTVTVNEGEYIAKNIPSFLNLKNRTYGNTKRSVKVKDNITNDNSTNYLEYYDEKMIFNTPWIPMLSNACVSIPALKDAMLESYEYAEDFMGHRLNVPTGANAFKNSGEFSAQFKDSKNNPVHKLFYVWFWYIDGVNNGTLFPRWSNIVNRILDYTCSVYVFTLDRDGQTIKYWCKYTGCSPRTLPYNMIFHQSTNLDSDSLNNINISFTYNYVEAMNPEIFTDFNMTSETEWRRKLNPDHSYFSIENTSTLFNKPIDPSKVWTYLDFETEAGLSGKPPIKALQGRMDTGHLGHYKAWMSRENNRYERDYNNHYGGYPYIINGGRHFVWINPYLALRKLNDYQTYTDNKGNKFVSRTPEGLTNGRYLENETRLIIG